MSLPGFKVRRSAPILINVGVRDLMDRHMTYDKERVLNIKEGEHPEQEEKKDDKFIWSYIIRPVKKDYDSR